MTRIFAPHFTIHNTVLLTVHTAHALEISNEFGYFLCMHTNDIINVICHKRANNV